MRCQVRREPFFRKEGAIRQKAILSTDFILIRSAGPQSLKPALRLEILLIYPNHCHCEELSANWRRATKQSQWDRKNWCIFKYYSKI